LKILKSKYIWTSGLSIALFVLGQFLFVKTFEFFEPKIDGIYFRITENKAIIQTSTFFSLFLFLIPIAIVFTWQLAHITASNKKIASALLILLFIAIGIFVRHQEVKKYFITVVKPALLTKGRAGITYPIDPVNFAYYMFAGLITGCLLVFIVFKQRKKHKP
jgi:hypothetical protein